jgi:hypothetical protein
MSKYLFIESRDGFESRDTSQGFKIIEQLADDNHDIALYLTQNGVLSARKLAQLPGFHLIPRSVSQHLITKNLSLEKNRHLLN